MGRIAFGFRNTDNNCDETQARIRLHCTLMRGRRVVAAAMLLAAVAACTPEPPPYEPRYAPPAPPAAAPPPLPPGASFLDNFDRPDTPLGLGAGWDLRQVEGPDSGKPRFVPATDGFIRAGRFTSSSDESVYAWRAFRSPIRRIGAEAGWRRVGNGAAETFMLAIAANDRVSSDLVQLVVSPGGWGVETRRGNGKFRTKINGKFDPPLELDRQYRFELDAADSSVTVRVPGAEKTVNVGTIGLLSEHAFWRYVSAPTERPVGAKFTADMVWVAEKGQPLSPIPAAK